VKNRQGTPILVATGLLAALSLAVPVAAAARSRAEKRDQAMRYYRLGQVQYEQGKTSPAIEAIEKALSIDPDFAEAHNYLGFIHLQQSELKEAERAFRRAVKIDPYFTDAWMNLGLAYRERQKFDQALDAFGRALNDKTYRSTEKIHFNVGHLHLARGDYPEAIRSFEQALQSNPKYLRGILGLAMAYDRSGRPDLAERELRRVLSLGPESPEAAEARQLLARLPKPGGS
jgi:Tfp pilus assembly protein PilF